MSEPVVAELGSHLGFWLRFVSNHVAQGFAARLAGQGVTVAEWVLLRSLYDEDEMAPSRVAAAMGMTRGAVSKLAERLLGKGLVARQADQEDGRAQLLALTPRGRELVPVLAALADANEQEFFGGLKPEDRALLYVLLQRLVKAGGMRDAA